MYVGNEHIPGELDAGMSPSGALVASVVESPKWFAVYTTPRHEKAVARHFEFRRIESFLPLYMEMHRWKNGCRVNVEQPLFPGYIFARIGRRDSTQVLSVPGVLLIVGSGREPLALPDFEIEALRSGLHPANLSLTPTWWRAKKPASSRDRWPAWWVFWPARRIAYELCLRWS
jgi:hypothetical protein